MLNEALFSNRAFSVHSRESDAEYQGQNENGQTSGENDIKASSKGIMNICKTIT